MDHGISFTCEIIIDADLTTIIQTRTHLVRITLPRVSRRKKTMTMKMPPVYIAWIHWIHRHCRPELPSTKPAQKGPNPVPKMAAKAKRPIGTPRSCEAQMSAKAQATSDLVHHTEVIFRSSRHSMHSPAIVPPTIVLPVLPIPPWMKRNISMAVMLLAKPVPMKRIV